METAKIIQENNCEAGTPVHSDSAQNVESASYGEERILRSVDFISATIANFCSSFGISIVIATLPLYILAMGGNKTDAGIVTGTAQLTALLLRPFIGWLTDAWRRRPVVLMGTACYGLANVVYLLANSIPLLIFGRIIHGSGASCYTTGANAYVADIAPPKRRAETIGIFTAAQAVGGIIGPAIGFYIIESSGYRHLFYFTGSISFIAFFVSLPAKERRPAETIKNHPWSPRTDILAVSALPLSWMAMCMGMGFGTVSAFIAIYAQPRGMTNPGFFFTVQAIALLLSRACASRFADRYGRAAAIIPAVILMAMALSILPMAHGFPMFCIIAALFGFGYGIAHPATMALLIDSVGVKQRGLAISTYYIGFDVGMAMGSVLLGMITQHLGFGVMWPVAATVTFLSLAGLFLNQRRSSDR